MQKSYHVYHLDPYIYHKSLLSSPESYKSPSFNFDSPNLPGKIPNTMGHWK